MTPLFTPGDLARLRSAQTRSMVATGKILVYSAGTLNEFNEDDNPNFTPSSALSCGIEFDTGSERSDQTFDKIQTLTDAKLRLPLGTSVKPEDRFQLTHIAGEALATPLTFEIESPIQQGPTGLRLKLRNITPTR